MLVSPHYGPAHRVYTPNRNRRNGRCSGGVRRIGQRNGCSGIS